MPTQDEKDYQDYQDYLAYLDHQGKTTPKIEPTAADKLMSTPFLQKVKQNTDEALSPEGITKIGATALLPGMGASLASKLGSLGRIGIGALTGGTVSAAQDQNAPLSETFPRGAAVGGAISGLGELGSKAADVLMQKAVGMNKYKPGMGKTLIDEGLIGTKEGLKNQVENRLDKNSDRLAQLIKGLPGKVESQDVADKVGSFANKYITPEGNIPASVRPEVDAIRARAADISQRGAISPEEALSLKRIASKEGYKAGNPLATLEAKLAQTESGGYGDAIKDLYAKANPEAPNAVADVNEKLAALINANRSLNKEETLRKGLPLGDIAGGLAGTALGGVHGGLAGLVAAHALKSPLVQSAGAQGADTASSILSDPRVQAIINQSLFSKDGEGVK